MQYSTHSITELAALWIESLDLAPTSRETYSGGLKAYLIWHCAVKGYSEKSFSAARILEFKRENEGKASANSLAVYFAALKSFFGWAEKQRFILPNPMPGLRAPRKQRGYSRIPLTKEQVVSLLNAVDRSTNIGVRNFAIINLQIFLGLRRIEIVRLDVGDILNATAGKALQVWGKGATGKSKTIPLPEFLFQIIQNYLSVRTKVNKSDPLFISSAYRNDGGRLSPRFISAMVKKYLRSVGIDDPRICCHSLRHTAAVLLLKSGCPFNQVQQLLRHTSGEITRIYTHYIENEILMEQTGKFIENLYDSVNFLKSQTLS